MADSAAAPDWLAACRRIAERTRAMLDALPSTAERVVVVGEGAGGDRTLVIDRAAEDIAFAELERLHAAGTSFVAISEERGEVGFGGGPVRVVIDPIDGSLNAKRGLAPYAVSIAVADGPAMSDVAFGYVAELSSGEEWAAWRGGGARRNGDPIDPAGAAERRTRRGLLEVVGVEAAHPQLVEAAAVRVTAAAHRTRTFGSIAWSLCQVGAGRLDGMVTLGSSRSVDA